MAWTISNNYLTESQMQGNALEVYNFFSARGWTLNAIAGMLGNMERESNINPGLWQSLNYGNYSGGYGLVQWTPATNYTDWASSHGYSITDPQGQMIWIDTVTVSSGQWIATSEYNLSFDSFKKSTQSPEWLASAFMKNFERAGVEAEGERRSDARKWYDYLAQNGSSQVIEDAVEWAIGIANDDSHGYDQTNRWGPDYDCSSLVIQAWQNAGVPVKTQGASYTGNMYDAFIACGFIDVTSQVNLSSGSGVIRGDVLLNIVHHTAMSIGNGQIVQASINEHGETTGGQTGDQTGREIYTRSYYNYPWDKVLRYPGGGGSITPSGGVYIVRFVAA